VVKSVVGFKYSVVTEWVVSAECHCDHTSVVKTNEISGQLVSGWLVGHSLMMRNVGDNFLCRRGDNFDRR